MTEEKKVQRAALSIYKIVNLIQTKGYEVLSLLVTDGEVCFIHVSSSIKPFLIEIPKKYKVSFPKQFTDIKVFYIEEMEDLSFPSGKYMSELFENIEDNQTFCCMSNVVLSIYKNNINTMYKFIKSGDMTGLYEGEQNEDDLEEESEGEQQSEDEDFEGRIELEFEDKDGNLIDEDLLDLSNIDKDPEIKKSSGSEDVGTYIIGDIMPVYSIISLYGGEDIDLDAKYTLIGDKEDILRERRVSAIKTLTEKFQSESAITVNTFISRIKEVKEGLAKIKESSKKTSSIKEKMKKFPNRFSSSDVAKIERLESESKLSTIELEKDLLKIRDEYTYTLDSIIGALKVLCKNP